MDAESEVSERLPWEHLTDEDLKRGAAALTGDIQQVGGGWAGSGCDVV